MGPRTCLVWCRKSSAYNEIQSPDYAGLADKTLKIRYTKHIRYTRSHNQKRHMQDIFQTTVMDMALLMKSWSCQNPSQKGCRMNVLVNFHILLHKCIFKVIQPQKIWEPSLQFEKTHDIQLRYACIYKSLLPQLCYS